jgi:hypothetical protein
MWVALSGGMERLFATALLCALTQLACASSSPSEAGAQVGQRAPDVPHQGAVHAPTMHGKAAQPAQPTSHGQTVAVSSHEARPRGVTATAQTCNTVMSEQALCECLTRRSEEPELGRCQMQTFATPEFATMTTPGGDAYAIAFYRKGWYELTRLHTAGMEDFAVRKARVERVGDKRVVRIVTYAQIGESEWMHTANQLVLCTLTKPWLASGGCSRHPLYAHTRAMVSDDADESESRFRVQLTDEGAHVSTRGGPLQHPELMAAIGTHDFGE